MAFSKDFVWGAATSAIQVEGGVHEGNKGPSVWDVFSHTPGKVKDGYFPEDGCDHYYRFADDIALMKKMGIKAYRFSIDWSRILPLGFGAVSEEGLGFYDRLIDKLLSAGIEPYVTLFHWELPQALEELGGWLNPSIVDWFGNYAAVISSHFSDRVHHFFTINEPQCFIGLGYVAGVHAPGKQLPLDQTLLMAHHVLMANGRAAIELRSHAKHAIQVGFAPTSSVAYPASESPADIEAARREYFSIPKDTNRWFWNVSLWSDPVFFGHYPDEAFSTYGSAMPKITDEDMALIHQPFDFYGQNIYNGYAVRQGQDGRSEVVPRPAGFPRTASGWPITPEALYFGPKFLYERYHTPIYITENGISCCDVVSLDGAVHDPERIDFLSRYLGQLKKAASEIDLRGYFLWSLMDNFEWSDGYTQRFGLWYVDYTTKKRIPKDSAYWYREIMATNGRDL